MFSFYQRWRQRHRARRQTLRDIKQNLELLVRLQILGADRTFSFVMFGEEVRLYLPYAGFDYIQTTILSSNCFYELELLDYVRKTCFDGSPCTVLDIGGNIGNHAVYFSKFCNAHVETFEPQKAIFRILEKNLGLNACNAKAHNLALGETSGLGTFVNYNPINTGANSISEVTHGTFEIRTVDSFNFENVRFIKIDVEGFEEHVLRGARETLARCRPILWIEIFPDKMERVALLLNELGYVQKKQLADANFIYAPEGS